MNTFDEVPEDGEIDYKKLLFIKIYRSMYFKGCIKNILKEC